MYDYRINYIITMAKQELREASPFFGFTRGAISSLSITQYILGFPHSVLQFFETMDQAIASKISGATYKILPLEIEALSHLPIKSEGPFWCIISTAHTQQAVSAFINSTPQPILHLTTAQSESEENTQIENATHQTLLDHCISALKYMRKIGETVPAIIDNLPQKLPSHRLRRLKLRHRNHFVTYPNEVLLERSGYHLNGVGPAVASLSDKTYIDAIVDSAECVLKERARILRTQRIIHPSPISIILACPGFYQHIYRHQSRSSPETRAAAMALSSLKRQRHYHLEVRARDEAEIKDSNFLGMLKVISSEMLAFTRAITVKSVSHFAPVLRLPPSLNLFFGALSDLARCSRGNSPHTKFKQGKLYKSLKRDIGRQFPREFMPFIEEPTAKVKIIGNAPLEWLPMNGLPLMIRRESSRIPSTPGNALMAQTAASKELIVPLFAFEEILVVRSFEPHDELKEVLSTALDMVKPFPAPRVKIRIVDVATCDEFIDVLNSFRGILMIFDGHGKVAVNGVGELVLGGVPVNLFQYRQRLVVPPIVVLSACDTHAIDGAHASVANTFLMLGATTVLGTLLPVNAQYSALFISRLILRIREFLPIASKRNSGIRWSTVVWGMQQMTFISELLFSLFNSRRMALPKEAFRSLQSKVNELIFENDVDWYEKFVSLAAGHFGKSQSAIREELDQLQFVEVLRYVQLGNPDQILIVEKLPHC